MTIKEAGQWKGIEDDPDFYKTLLESTKAIPWKIDWNSLTFTYIGPQIEHLLGWPRNSWNSFEDWAERMHPEDRKRVVEFCLEQSRKGADHEADYRALTQQGDYVWIRDVVHVLRDQQGNMEALVGFMFDISERKKIEIERDRLREELEELSYLDSLTGVANRRMLDQVLEREWMEARRQQQSLSIIMFDIDYFKQYNDSFGHFKGDECLREVAQLLTSSATRARDFVARFGGEEFVLVLPQTDAAAAKTVAQRCFEKLKAADIHHPSSPVAQRITLSCGVATSMPTHTDSLDQFLEQADRALYRAKEGSRNCIQVACSDGKCVETDWN